MNHPGLRAALAVFAGLMLTVPLLLAREFGWYLAGGRRLGDPASIAQVGIVALDALTDAPLHGVLTWSDGARGSARTGDSGRAELELEPGTRWLVAGGRGRALTGLWVELPPGGSEQVFRLLPLEKLAGRVLLPDGGAAAGATVEATPLAWPGVPVETPPADEDGRFLVPRPSPGSYRVEAALEGAGRAVALVRTPDEDVLLRLTPEPLPEVPGAEERPDNVLAAPRGGRTLEVRGPDGGVVAGALVLGVEADGGEPGAALRQGRLPLLCATDLEGHCVVPEAAHCVVATAQPHADSAVACDTTALQLREGLLLSGRVALEAAAGGWLEAEDGPVSAVGRDGQFVLGPLPAGTHALWLHGASGTRLGGTHVTLPLPGGWTWPAQTESPSR